MNSEIRALIIDDEERARLSLKLLLEEFCPEVKVVAECKNLPEGVKAIHKEKPQLVFLDIEMPGHSGLELLDFFAEKDITFSIIFTTAYNNYAIKAFKLSAVDYLLKPINPQELQHAITLAKKQSQIAQISALKNNLAQQDTILGIPVSGKIIFVNTNDILYLKASGAYTQIVKTDNSSLLVSRNLKSFEDNFEYDKKFLRIHKSYIINTTHIKSVMKAYGGSVELVNGEEIPASADKLNDILEAVKVLKF